VESLEKRGQTSAAKTKPAAPKPSASNGKLSHTVQKGETLAKISKKYGVSVKELRKLNNLSESQGIHPGQKLLISPGR
jgi:LysM repeat protein